MNLKEPAISDYLNQRSVIGIVTGVLISTFALIALFYIKPPSRRKESQSIAFVESSSNKVRHKLSGSVSFFDISPMEKLENSDEIYTGEESSAVIRFSKSKTILKIPSSSLVRIEEGTDGDIIEVKDGLIDIVLSKNEKVNLVSQGVKHQIAASEKKSVIKAYQSSGELHLFTNDTGVKIKNNQSESELISHQDATLDEKTIKSPSVFKLISPTPGEAIENTDGIKISTDLKSNYRITLSPNTEFTKSNKATNFTGTNYKWEPTVDEGNFYLKIEDTDSKESKIIPISLYSKFKIDGFTPVDGDQLIVSPTEKIQLRWNPIAVNSYKVFVRSSAGKEFTYITKSNQIQIDPLKGSGFDWLVQAETADGKYSNINKLNHVGLKFKGQVELIGQVEKRRYKTTEDKINIAWNAESSEKFMLKVINSKSNTEYLSKEIQGGSADIPIRASGTFNAEVSSLDYPGMKKAELEYDVESPLLTWDEELKNGVKSTEENDEIELRYKSYFSPKMKLLLLVKYFSSDDSHSDKEIKFPTDNKFKFDGFGKYCFKAHLKSPVDYFIDSDEICLTLTQLPVFPSIPKAADTILSSEKQEGFEVFKIKVPAINKAAEYEVEIYQDKEMSNSVFATKSNKPEINWRTDRSGIFYLRYRVYDKRKRVSAFSPTSRVIFPISPLSEW